MLNASDAHFPLPGRESWTFLIGLGRAEKNAQLEADGVSSFAKS